MTSPALIERITRSLAYMLRHQPERFDLELDAHGYGNIDDVLRALIERLGETVTLEDLTVAVTSGDRARYEIVGDKIRALYGHSIDVEPGESTRPPERLFVGISSRDADRALRNGLRGGRRRFLHLALTEEDARESGRRSGRDYSVLTVFALDAWESGIHFYDRKSLFLAEQVPTQYLELSGEHHDGFERTFPEGGGEPRRERERGRPREHGREGRGHGQGHGRGAGREREREREPRAPAQGWSGEEPGVMLEPVAARPQGDFAARPAEQSRHEGEVRRDQPGGRGRHDQGDRRGPGGGRGGRERDEPRRPDSGGGRSDGGSGAPREERGERERFERPGRVERPQPAERQPAERPFGDRPPGDRGDRGDRADRGDRFHRGGERGDRRDRPDRPDRADRSDRADRPDRAGPRPAPAPAPAPVSAPVSASAPRTHAPAADGPSFGTGIFETRSAAAPKRPSPPPQPKPEPPRKKEPEHEAPRSSSEGGGGFGAGI